VRASNRIAVPGCHASAFVLAVRPLVEAGLMPADYPASAFSLTGYSGGGKSMIAEFEAGGNPKLMSPRPYAWAWRTSTCRKCACRPACRKRRSSTRSSATS
jgi:N-acetyl-gamma-glutamyl-phosphate reductase